MTAPDSVPVPTPDIAAPVRPAARGLNRYEFRPLSDGSGVQVSQDGRAILLDWATVLDLGAALIDAYRRRAER